MPASTSHSCNGWSRRQAKSQLCCVREPFTLLILIENPVAGRPGHYFPLGPSLLPWQQGPGIALVKFLESGSGGPGPLRQT
jgi:hypothetical protein